MITTMDEKVGDVIYGAHLTVCHYNRRFNADGDLVLCKDEPLIAGKGDETVGWTRKETAPGGWERTVSMSLDTVSRDESRAASRFEVVSVTTEPLSGGRDAGFGGGPRITVKRLDGNGEVITYTRRCYYNSDVYEPAILVSHP